jgi:hypothetical protein
MERAREQEANLCAFEASVGAAIVGKCGRERCERFSKKVADNKPYYRAECSEGVCSF